MAMSTIQDSPAALNEDAIHQDLQANQFNGNGLPLPNELIIKILADIPPNDHANICFTCKNFSICANDSDYWVQVSNKIDDLAEILNNRDSIPVNREALIKDFFKFKAKLASNSRTFRYFSSGRISEMSVDGARFLERDGLKKILSEAFKVECPRFNNLPRNYNLGLLNQVETLDKFIVMNIEKIESLFDENNLSEVGKVFFANMELRADLDQGKYCSLLLQDLNNSSDLSKAKRILALTLNYPHLVEHIFLKCNYVRTVIDQIGETFFKSEDMWVNACHLGHLSHIVKNWNSYGRQIVIGGYTDDCAKMLRVYKYARLSGNDLVAKELLGRFLTNHLNRIRFAAKIAGESALVCVISTCFAELIGIMVHYGLNHNQFPHRACALCALKINHLQLSRQVLFKCVVLYVLLLALFYMGITTTIALCGIGFLFFKDLYKGYYLSSTPGMDDNKKQIWTVPR